MGGALTGVGALLVIPSVVSEVQGPYAVPSGDVHQNAGHGPLLEREKLAAETPVHSLTTDGSCGRWVEGCMQPQENLGIFWNGVWAVALSGAWNPSCYLLEMGDCPLKRHLEKSSRWGFVVAGQLLSSLDIHFPNCQWKGHVTCSLSSETPEPSPLDLSEPLLPTHEMVTLRESTLPIRVTLFSLERGDGVLGRPAVGSKGLTSRLGLSAFHR